MQGQQGSFPNPDRRNLVRAGIALTSTGIVATVGYPVVRYLKSSSPVRSVSPDVTSDVCADSTLGPSEACIVRHGQDPVIVVRDSGAQLLAFSARCTHLGCTVRFRPDRGDLYCACHGATFDAASGQNRMGPATQPLVPYRVEVRDGRIVVSPG